MKTAILWVILACFALSSGAYAAYAASGIPADLQRRADSNEPDALYDLATLHYLEAACPSEGADSEIGTLQDRKSLRSAIVALEKAVKLGHMPSAKMLGEIFSGRHCGTRTPSKALEFYALSAKGGDPDSIVNVGILYAMEKQFKEALPWLMKGIKYNNPSTYMTLANMLHYGDGIEKNMTRAYACWLIVVSIEPSYASAFAKTLSDFKKQLTPEELSEAQKLHQHWKQNKDITWN